MVLGAKIVVQEQIPMLFQWSDCGAKLEMWCCGATHLELQGQYCHFANYQEASDDHLRVGGFPVMTSLPAAILDDVTSGRHLG